MSVHSRDQQQNQPNQLHQVQWKVVDGANQKLTLRFELDVDSSIELDVDSSIELDVDSSIELDVDSSIELDVDSSIELDVDSSIELEVVSSILSAFKIDSSILIELEVDCNNSSSWEGVS